MSVHEPGQSHPSMGCYTNHGCRCDGCRAANATRARAYRSKGKRQVSTSPIIHTVFTKRGDEMVLYGTPITREQYRRATGI